MRFWHITVFMICFNFSLAIVGGLALVSLALATWLRRRAGGANT